MQWRRCWKDTVWSQALKEHSDNQFLRKFLLENVTLSRQNNLFVKREVPKDFNFYK